MRKDLLIDVDNVLRDIMKPCLDIYNKEFGTKIRHEDVKAWDLAETFTEIEPAYVQEYFFKQRDHAMQVFEQAPLQEPLIPWMMNCLIQEHNIHLVTHQYRQNIPFTMTWLYAHDIPFTSVSFTADKSRMRGDILLDDSRANLESVVKHGTIPIARDQPWNKMFQGGRVYTFDQFMKVVKGLYG